MTVDLTTTNVLLGIMAFVSLLEAIALIGAGVMALRLYRQMTAQLDTLEQRHVAPLAAQANEILAHVKAISGRVQNKAERLDHAVEQTVDKANAAVDRMQGGVRKSTDVVVGVVRGVRTAVDTFLNTNGKPLSARERGSAVSPDRAPAPYVTVPDQEPAASDYARRAAGDAASPITTSVPSSPTSETAAPPTATRAAHDPYTVVDRHS